MTKLSCYTERSNETRLLDDEIEPPRLLPVKEKRDGFCLFRECEHAPPTGERLHGALCLSQSADVSRSNCRFRESASSCRDYRRIKAKSKSGRFMESLFA